MITIWNWDGMYVMRRRSEVKLEVRLDGVSEIDKHTELNCTPFVQVRCIREMWGRGFSLPLPFSLLLFWWELCFFFSFLGKSLLLSPTITHPPLPSPPMQQLNLELECHSSPYSSDDDLYSATSLFLLLFSTFFSLLLSFCVFFISPLRFLFLYLNFGQINSIQFIFKSK